MTSNPPLRFARSQANPRLGGDSSVSVVICAHSSERLPDLVAAVRSAVSQTRHLLEVIVVIDHNRDLFLAASDALTGARVVENRRSAGASGARNFGTSISHGSVVAFLDDDAVASPDWLADLMLGFRKNDVIGVGGRIDPLWLAGEPAWFPREFGWVVGATYEGMPDVESRVRNLWSGNMAMRRDVFDAIGGFREGFGKVGGQSDPEDNEICMRASREFPEMYWVLRPDAAVQHKVPRWRSSVRYFVSRSFAEGVGKARLARLTSGTDSTVAERSYATRTLPVGFLREASAFATGDLAGAARAGAIVTGFLSTCIGFVFGTAQAALATKPHR